MEREDLTIYGASKLSGITDKALYSWRSESKRGPYAAYLRKFCRTTGISADYLLGIGKYANDDIAESADHIPEGTNSIPKEVIQEAVVELLALNSSDFYHAKNIINSLLIREHFEAGLDEKAVTFPKVAESNSSDNGNASYTGPKNSEIHDSHELK